MPEFSASQIRAAYRKAAVSALNKTLITCRAAAIKQIRETHNVQASALRDRITIRRAQAGKLEGYLIVRGERGDRIPLGKFRATQNRTGVRVLVSKVRPTIIRHAFIPQLPSGHRGVFIRKGPKRAMKRGRYAPGTGDALTFYKRQPIIEMAGPTPANLYQKSNAVEVVKAAARELGRVLQHEMKFRLGGGR